MAMPARSDFILAPATNPVSGEVDIEAALEAFRALLAAAVADPGDHAAFTAAHTTFTTRYECIATELPLADATAPDYSRQGWWINLSAAGFETAGLAAADIRRLLEALPSASELITRLTVQPNLDERDSDRFEEIIEQGVKTLLRHFWVLLNDTTLAGMKMSEPRVRVYGAVEHHYAFGLMIGALAKEYPVSGGTDLDYTIWQYALYRLALQLIGHQPAS